MKRTVIFKCLAIAGVVTTAYLTAKAVPYLEDYKEELIAGINFSENSEEKFEAKKNFLINSAKVLTPAIISGAATIGSITMLDSEHSKIQAAILASLYASLDQIRQAKGLGVKFIPVVDEDNPLPRKKKGEIIVCEPYSGHVFATTQRLVEKAQEKANKRLNNFYFETLNRFLKDLGSDICSFGDGFGWSCNTDFQMEKWKESGPCLGIRLVPEDKGGGEYYMIEYDVEPSRIWS